MAKDPVCGHEVDPATVEWKSTFGGKVYYFCEPDCRKTFDKNPRKYVR